MQATTSGRGMVWSGCPWCQASVSCLECMACAETSLLGGIFPVILKLCHWGKWQHVLWWAQETQPGLSHWTAMHPILDACSQVCCLHPAWQQLWQGPMSHHAPSTSFGMALLITACSLSPLQAHHRASHFIQIPFPSPALNHHQANISACMPVPKECLIISLFLLSFLLALFKSKIICTSLWPQRQYKTNVSTWK